MGQGVLRLIGYWHGPWVEKGWPDVRSYVDPSPVAEDQRAVARYLRSGTVFVAMAGISYCRICGVANGSTELTDGEHFVWPEGLIHYVEAHDIRLPEEVVVLARQRLADPVDALKFGQELVETGDLTIDEQWWRELGR